MSLQRDVQKLFHPDHLDGQKAFPIFRFLSTTGQVEESGPLVNAIGDYSLQMQSFFIEPPDNRTYNLARMLVLAAGPSALDGYATLPELAVGVKCKIKRRISGEKYVDTGPENFATIVDITNGFPIQLSVDWAGICYDAQTSSIGGGANAQSALQVRWTFVKSGVPMRLEGSEGLSFHIELNDDFSEGLALSKHTFHVQGWIEGGLPN